MSPRARYLAFAISLLVAAACVRLGFWQVSRLRQRRAANAAALAQRDLPPVDLAGATSSPPDLANRRVVAIGAFDRTHEVVIRGRVDDKSPGVHVVTPLRLSGRETAVLVNRGFAPAPDAVHAELDSLDEPGTVTVRGLALPITSEMDGGEPLESRGRTTWRRLDLAALRARMPYPILDVYVLWDSGERAGSGTWRLRPLAPPALDDGPHLNYAIQWFAFAVIGVVGGVVILRGRRAPKDLPR